VCVPEAEGAYAQPQPTQLPWVTQARPIAPTAVSNSEIQQR